MGQPSAQQASVRAVNRSLVLDLLRRSGSLSRPDLAKQTGLTLPTIGAIVDDLIAEGLAIDRGAGVGSARGGRRPRLLEFNSAARRVLGVNIGVHRTTVAVGDARGELVARLDAATPNPAEVDAVVALVSSMAKRLRRELGDVDGAGICVPGLVESGSGVCLAARNLGWDVVPIGPLLAEALQVETMVLNSTHAAAVAEQVHGVSQGVRDMVWIHVGTGIGAGIINGDRLLRGSRGLTGEFGHVPIEDGGPLCGCGRRGCLEAVASGGALVREALAAGAGYGGGDTFGPGDIVGAAAAGDKLAIELLTRSGRQVGRAAVALVHIVNPAQVVLGGSIGSTEGVFTKAFRDGLSSHAIPFSLGGNSVVCSTLGGEAAVRGTLLVARQASDLGLRLVIGGRA